MDFQDASRLRRVLTPTPFLDLADWLGRRNAGTPERRNTGTPEHRNEASGD